MSLPQLLLGTVNLQDLGEERIDVHLDLVNLAAFRLEMR
jgi:hypothetical protein